MKKVIETIIGLIIMLVVLYSFTKINIDYFIKDKEPSNYIIYISLFSTLLFMTSIVINNNDENNNEDNNKTNFK